MIRIIPEESITFPAAEHFRASVMKLSEGNSLDVILDCKNLKRTDVTVAKVSDANYPYEGKLIIALK